MEKIKTLTGFVSSKPNGQISMNPFHSEIWDFKELKGRAKFADDADKVKTIFEARGGWTLTNLGNNAELMRYVNNFDYDRNLLVWHVATKICYTTVGAINGEEPKQQEFAKMFSHYMNYLLIKKPEMTSSVSGIGHIRYIDTCSEITHFCGEFKSRTVNDFCTILVDELTSSKATHEYSKKGASVLFDVCNLAKALRLKDKKWEIINVVWVEMQTYAAGHCRLEKHARAPAEGDEFVTIVWLFMAHMGIGPHFPYRED